MRWILDGLWSVCSAWFDEQSSTQASELFPPRKDLDDLYDSAVDEAICSGLDFLVSQLREDGSFQSADQGKWVGVCSLAGWCAFESWCKIGSWSAGMSLRKIGQYVLSQVQGSGFICSNSNTSHGPMYDHGFGTLFLSELLGTDSQLDIRSKLTDAQCV